jgi:serine/threonine protein kinase
MLAKGSSANAAKTTLMGTPAELLQHVDLCVGSYRIVGALGEGGCGAVWLAEHQVIGTKVAIKILRPEISALPGINERFITEARSAAAIASPHVARYLDIGRLPSGQPYAVMEYLEGETVHERLKRAGVLTIADSIAVARQAADALALAHEAGIVHRDVHGASYRVGRDCAKRVDGNGDPIGRAVETQRWSWR